MSSDLKAAIKECTSDREMDMFSYSGGIYSDIVNQFIVHCLNKHRHKKLTLVLTTFGGDPHAAYRLARFLQSVYRNIRLLIVGPCKSAGTLVSICANELVFAPTGELGPLDIQVAKKDDLVGVASGLDTFQALTIIQTHAFAAFKNYMVEMVEGSDGTISTEMACRVATQLATGLFQPLTAQLDPQRMGEMQRNLTVAKAYGTRIGTHNLKEGSLDKLVQDYPSHSFIIDYREAKQLFNNVKWMSPAEARVVQALEETGACISYPRADSMFFDVAELLEDTESANETASDGSAKNTGTDVSGEPSEPGPEAQGTDNGATRPTKKRARKPRGATQAAP